jgi:hypothetical protein
VRRVNHDTGAPSLGGIAARSHPQGGVVGRPCCTLPNGSRFAQWPQTGTHQWLPIRGTRGSGTAASIGLTRDTAKQCAEDANPPGGFLTLARRQATARD